MRPLRKAKALKAVSTLAALLASASFPASAGKPRLQKNAEPLRAHSANRFPMAVRYGGDRIVLQAAHELVENTESAIEEAGSETGIPGALLRGVVKVETGVSPYAVSRSNARGNAQLTKIARNEVARRFNYRPNDIYDLKQNAKVAGWYLRLLLTRHVPARKGFSPKNRASNIRAALAMYRLGPNDPRIRGPEKTWPAGVRKYVDRAYGLYATHPASHKHAWLAKLQVAEK